MRLTAPCCAIFSRCLRTTASEDSSSLPQAVPLPLTHGTRALLNPLVTQTNLTLVSPVVKRFVRLPCIPPPPPPPLSGGCWTLCLSCPWKTSVVLAVSTSPCSLTLLSPTQPSAATPARSQRSRLAWRGECRAREYHHWTDLVPPLTPQDWSHGGASGRCRSACRAGATLDRALIGPCSGTCMSISTCSQNF